MDLHADFTFYPVGQGCFYAGSINLNNSKFVIVYDCGTLSKRVYLENQIVKFKEEYKRIDLLIISHFDEDHVNGIFELLSNNIECKKIIIPYYLPLLRLSLLAKGTDDEDYISFLQDPISYFLNKDRFNIDEIVVLGRDENEDNTNIKAPEPINPEGKSIESQKLIIDPLPLEDSNLRKYFIKNESISFEQGDNVKFVKLPFKLTISVYLWEFVFYLKDFNNPAGLKDFELDINKFLSENNCDMKSLFENEHREEIRSIYKDCLNIDDINYTSLIVYHGPIIKKESMCFFFNKHLPFLSPDIFTYPFVSIQSSGTLLTGDAFLKTKKDYDPFIKYYEGYYISNCMLLQVPHHGAEKNWKLLPNDLKDIPCYVINHGIGRIHPFPKVVENILLHSTHKNLKLNNEATEISYCISVLN